MIFLFFLFWVKCIERNDKSASYKIPLWVFPTVSHHIKLTWKIHENQSHYTLVAHIIYFYLILILITNDFRHEKMWRGVLSVNFMAWGMRQNWWTLLGTWRDECFLIFGRIKRANDFLQLRSLFLEKISFKNLLNLATFSHEFLACSIDILYVQISINFPISILISKN